jgi:hypothetical protein
MRCIYKPPAGYYLTDPFLLHDGTKWHLFYVTGRMEYCDEWIACRRRGDFAAAAKVPYEEGEGHAVGSTLFDLKYHSSILTKFQGEFAYALQGDSSIVRHGNRWVNLYSTRGPKGGSMSLAYSNDLFEWEFDPANPVIWPPDWAKRPGKFGHSWIVPFGETYLIYYCGQKETTSVAGLFSTKDFRAFTDHGPVIEVSYQLRGTIGVEAPTMIYRDHLWHLFYNVGYGTRPLQWRRKLVRRDGRGVLFLGPVPCGTCFSGPDEWPVVHGFHP